MIDNIVNDLVQMVTLCESLVMVTLRYIISEYYFESSFRC